MLAASALFRRKAVLMRSQRDLTSVFGMGTGVTLSLWPPTTLNYTLTFKQKTQGPPLMKTAEGL